MSLVRYKILVLNKKVVEVMYNVQDNDNIVVFNTETGKLVGPNINNEPFMWLGFGMGELPYRYEQVLYDKKNSVTCFGLEDGIRITDTDREGFKHWIYIPEFNPLFNLDYTVWIDAIMEEDYELYPQLAEPIHNFVKLPLTKRIKLAYQEAIST